MASTYLTRTFTAGDPEKWTWSAWVKRSKIGATNSLFSGNVDGNNRTDVKFNGSDQLIIEHVVSNSYVSRHITNRKFRDTSGWYHIVVVWDTGNASEYERQKFYINGVEENSWATETNCAQNTDSWMNNTASTVACNIGISDGGNYFDGYMSHVHYSDGYALAPTVFGETDATSGEWVINTSPSVTYGTNGFSILKDGNGITDQSGEGNNLTLAAGTLTDLQDCPDDVYATMNPLHDTTISLTNGTIAHSNSNNTIEFTTTSGNRMILSTLGVTSGKYYCEVEADALGNPYMGIGILAAEQSTNIYNNNSYCGKYSEGWHFGPLTTNNLLNNDTWGPYGTQYAAGDIIGIALDADNNKLYYSINGTWQNSGTGISITADRTWLFGCSGNNNCIAKWNFGNGYFGTTQLTGTTYQGSDGNGIFKYDPNNITLDSTTKSFKSVSTKGLNA